MESQDELDPNGEPGVGYFRVLKLGLAKVPRGQSRCIAVYELVSLAECAGYPG